MKNGRVNKVVQEMPFPQSTKRQRSIIFVNNKGDLDYNNYYYFPTEDDGIWKLNDIIVADEIGERSLRLPESFINQQLYDTIEIILDGNEEHTFNWQRADQQTQNNNNSQQNDNDDLFGDDSEIDMEDII